MTVHLGELRDAAGMLSVASSDILQARDEMREAADYIEKLEAIVQLAVKVVEKDPQKAINRPSEKDIKALRQALHEAGYL